MIKKPNYGTLAVEPNKNTYVQLIIFPLSQLKHRRSFSAFLTI